MLMRATPPSVTCRTLCGWCPQCGASFLSERPVDALCARCAADDAALYRNAPLTVDLPPAPWTKAAMRERLGVTGNEDV